ncbi:hypothetical protein D3C77_586360 [compost metagenome]
MLTKLVGAVDGSLASNDVMPHNQHTLQRLHIYYPTIAGNFGSYVGSFELFMLYKRHPYLASDFRQPIYKAVRLASFG